MYHVNFVGIQETKKSDYSPTFLRNLSGSCIFSWVWVFVKGQSTSILLSANYDVYDVLDSEIGRFHVRLYIRDKMLNVCYNIVTVYGAPHARDKEAFIVELMYIFSLKNVP